MAEPVPAPVASRSCPACGAAVPGVITRCPECGKPVSPAPPPPPPAAPAPSARSGRSLVLLAVMGAVAAGVALVVWLERGPEVWGPLQDGSELPTRPLPPPRPDPEAQVHAGLEAQREKLLGRIAQLKRRVGEGPGGGDTSRVWNGLAAFERKARAAKSAAELESLGHSLRDWERATPR